jgi:hypothetical protein
MSRPSEAGQVRTQDAVSCVLSVLFFGIRRCPEVSFAPNCKLDEHSQCDIRSLRVPGSICRIGSRVFFDCRSLREMEYGNSVLYWHTVALDRFDWIISQTREVVSVSHLCPASLVIMSLHESWLEIALFLCRTCTVCCRDDGGSPISIPRVKSFRRIIKQPIIAAKPGLRQLSHRTRQCPPYKHR